MTLTLPGAAGVAFPGRDGLIAFTRAEARSPARSTWSAPTAAACGS